jgi:para-aminobenzoate synthetase component I
MRRVALRRLAWREPLDVLSAFADEPWALGLLSGGGGERGRWSYLARRPEAACGASPGPDALGGLRALLADGDVDPAGPPFQGGVAGLASYELGARFEPSAAGGASTWPDLAAARFSAVLAFDHQERTVVAVGRGLDAEQARARTAAAAGWLDEAGRKPAQGVLAASFEAGDAADYEAAAAEVVRRIAAGEIFQANIARRWTGRLIPEVGPFDVLARLAAQSAAPFAAYLRLAGRAVVSNSPERFLSVAHGVVEARPIKGTRPRGGDAAEDAALAEALRASAKDRAENVMIVDLMRNDLSRLCPPGTVKAPQICALESFANVHHLVSAVRGRLWDGTSAADLLAATFPPGSITGAPKVQAMKVIAELEPPRGPYCGALFWAGPDGGFDSSVLIRTLAMDEDQAGWRWEARAGAGITIGSDPADERRETEAKIAALRRALTGDSA